jgi:L,D-peptidoglycan transpeptidase YkuD (ErfK/YbiS/YcfS/YnhG family)
VAAGSTVTAAPGSGKLLGDVASLGPKTAATVPADATQAVVVRGDGPTSTTATIELYTFADGAWTRRSTWRGHLGAGGWTADHHEGDLRTPAGTYTLTDAGGRMPDPGSKLPYHRSDHFVPRGSSVFGDSLEGSFDYVIAIDFNRRTCVSPLDPTKPDGAERGGGIWLHVDHGGPTHGCVSVPRDGMVSLLQVLAPAGRPVVLMGDQASLSA